MGYQLDRTWAGRQLASRKQNCIFYNILPAGIIVVVHIGSHCLSNCSGHDGGGGRAAPHLPPETNNFALTVATTDQALAARGSRHAARSKLTEGRSSEGGLARGSAPHCSNH